MYVVGLRRAMCSFYEDNLTLGKKSTPGSMVPSAMFQIVDRILSKRTIFNNELSN